MQVTSRFEGSDSYVATADLKLAVNAALTLQRPLLIKGEPGTGKTMLAEEVAAALGRPLMQWHIKSTTKAQQGLYEYDAVSRLRDSQLGDERVRDINNYILKGVLWQAFTASEPVVLLIDEIDKADIEFPNDLLRELDRMEFYVYETREMVVAKHRPLVIITSNNEKELPDAFLRRCFFHYIKFPDKDVMEQIVKVHYPTLKQDLLAQALQSFYEVRDVPGLKKKPSTSELLDWLKLLLAEDIPLDALRSKDNRAVVPPLHGALLKNEQDVHLFERLGADGAEQPMIAVAPVTLDYNGVRLEPLGMQHADGLRAAAADGKLWELRITSVPEPHDVEAYIQRALDMPDRVAFAVLDAATGEVIGSTSYHDILPAVDRVEIGWTWYAKSRQRSHVNTSCKLMLLAHAFETLGCAVVGWRTDIFNFASQRAIERLGAKKDGVIRHNAVRRDGSIRDTVMYSLLAGEWPEIKTQLQYQLRRHAAG